MKDKKIMITWGRVLIILNNIMNKKTFIQFMSTTVLFSNYQRVGLCTTRNEDNSASSTGFTRHHFHIFFYL